MNTRTKLVSAYLPALLLALAFAAHAADLEYPVSLLKERQPVYEEGVGVNYREAVLPRLTPRERAALQGARILYPLDGPGGGLFGYHSRYGSLGKEIVLPVKSLRFFSDLCVATAWLWAKEYSLSSVYDYLNMLKYGNPKDLGLARMPLPLDALTIPESELDDPDVERVRSQCFSTGVVFILAHEIGHLVLGHQGYSGISPQQAQANEADADRFALDLMSRLGDLPFGTVFFFSYAAYFEPHRGDFPSTDAWMKHVNSGTHPISGQRLLAVADGLEQRASRFAAGSAQARSLANELRQVANVLVDEDMQQLLRIQGESTRPYMLAPRREHFWKVRPPDRPLPAVPFSGYFRGWIGARADNSVELDFVLLRKGERVHGRYSYAGIAGTLRGRIQDGELVYRYWEPGSKGEGRIRGDSRINGAWRSDSGLEGSVAAERQ